MIRYTSPQNFEKALPSKARDLFAHNQQTVLEHRDTLGRRVLVFR